MRYIERTKEDKGTYSVIVKQNFYYLPINANTVSTDYLIIFMIHLQENHCLKKKNKKEKNKD